MFPRFSAGSRVAARVRTAGVALVFATLAIGGGGVAAQPPPALDESDRLAFQAWFTLLADAQFERPTAGVIDCASLVRHAYREALRAHTPEWFRRTQLPLTVSVPDVRAAPPATGPAWRLFRVATGPDRFAEFADAATIVRYNARPLGRGTHALQPGDLLFFRQDASGSADHLMVFLGESRLDPSRRDWVVYHTGPQDGRAGEVRKAPLADLVRHPAARWRPLPSNPAFAGAFRLSILDRSR